MSEAPVPSYYRVMQTLRDEIERGHHVPGKAFITEREVCNRFKVSRTTAVRSLNELVREGLLIRQRGRGTFVSTPSSGSPKFSAEAGQQIGILLNGLTGQHTMAIIRGAEQVCRERGLHLLVFNSMASSAAEAMNIQRARDAGVIGLIVFPVDGYANLACFRELDEARLPFVMVDRYYPSIPTDVVVPDNFAAGYQLTNHLIRKGHEHIATILGEVNCTSIQDRLAGYRRAITEHNLAIEPELAALRDYASLPDNERRKRLSSWLEGPNRPTAYLAANSACMILVVTDLLALGVDLSDDLDLASMDNASTDPLLALAAATVELPSYEMGIEAMRLLIDRTESNVPLPARHVSLPIRLSTASSVTINLRANTA